MAEKSDEKTSHKLKRSARGILGGLTAQYVVGMLLAVFGDPEKHTLFGTILFFLHIIIGIMLLIGASVILSIGLKHRDQAWSKMTIYGFVSVIIAIAAGGTTVGLKDILSEISSFVMAVAFIAAFATYGRLLFILRK